MAKRNPASPSPWAFQSFPPDRWHRWRLDGATVYLLNAKQGWYWAASPKRPDDLRRDFGGPEEAEPPSELAVRRVVAPGPVAALRPFALSRPFVVMTTKPVSIHPGQDAEFLVDLPVSVRWMAQTGDILAHPNTIELHKTWFGDTAAGRLCFLWRTDLETPITAPFGSMFRCRIVVRNHTKAPMNLNSFPIYCEYLSLWESSGNLHSDVVIVEGFGDHSLKMSIQTDRLPRDALLYEAAVSQNELFFKRGVDFLRSIAGIS